MKKQNRHQWLYLMYAFLLLTPHAVYAQYELWVGETYQCEIDEYGNNIYPWSIVNISWEKSNYLYANYSGQMIYTVSFSEYVSGSHSVTAKWTETKIGTSDNIWNHRSHTWTFTCRDNPLILDKSGVTIIGNETATIEYHFSYSNSYTSSARLTFTSNNTSVATVDRNGVVTPKGNGTATITVHSNISKDNRAFYVTVTSFEEIKVSRISLDNTSISLTEGNGKWLTATVYPSNATNKSVTWSSSNSSVAYVNSSGYVTAKSAGNATITCKATDGSGVYATCDVTVTAAYVPVTGISLNTTSTTLYVDEYKQLTATVSPSNATNKNVTWSSSSSYVASVSSSGYVTANSAGTATITCRSDDNSSIYATCTVTVKNVSPTGITISPSARQTMAINDEKRFSYTLRPSNAVGSVTWSLSGDTDAATLSSSGWLTAKAEGTVCVKVTTANGYSDYCYVDIMPQPTAITVTPAEVEVVMGRTKQLSYSLSPDDARAHSVTWASSDNSIAYVTSSGLVEARRPGTVTITATTDNGKVGKCTFTVPVPLFQLFVWMKNGEKTGYLSTDKPHFRLKGDVVKFTTDQLSFDIQKDELDKFTLEQVLPEHPLNILTADNLKVGLGKQKQLLYELIPADAQTQVTWLNSDTSVVSITDNGMVTGLKVGTAIVKAQTSNGLRASCKITVPEPAFRFYVWLKDGDVESYPLEERPLVELGPEIFTLTTHTTTVGYAAKDVLKFTLEDSAVRAVDGDINRDGQLTVDDITTLIAIYLGELEAIKYDADLDGDHKVTVTDITKLIALYLKK